MDKHQFRLGMLIVIAIVLIVGTIGFFVNRNSEIQREADVQQAEIAQKIQEKKQEEATERTQERWDVLQRIPGLRDGKETK